MPEEKTYRCNRCGKGFKATIYQENKTAACPFCIGIGNEVQGHKPFRIKVEGK